MHEQSLVSRRTVLGGAAAGAVGLALGGAPLSGALADPGATQLSPLWKVAAGRGLLYGSSTATWQLDPSYSALFRRQAALLFTEDDLLWYRLKPKPTSPLDFTYSDQIIEFAERNRQLVLGAHLVWDEGFGDGWTDDDLYSLDERAARRLLFGTMRAVMSRYRGRVAIWSVVNEAIVNGTDQGYRGLRKDYPWFATIGPDYIEDSFHIARETDRHACLMLNDFGYETVNQYGDRPVDKMRATLQVIDHLLDKKAPLQAFGIQAHLLAQDFADRFHVGQYRRFLRELTDRGLKILITELDVLDDGLPKAPGKRDVLVGDVYRRYLDVALTETDIAAVVSFGLSDRYTWLDEDYPRDDGAHRRPLPFSDDLRPKHAYWALRTALGRAPSRRPVFKPVK